VFAAWMEAQPEFSWLNAWQQGTIFYNPGVRPVEIAPR
jgi:hypothetical protein